jgi:hypothetical protein
MVLEQGGLTVLGITSPSILSDATNATRFRHRGS